jgi:hypothetical protein
MVAAARRPRPSATSLVTSPILFAIAAAVLALSARALIRFANAADLFDLAASIERDGELPDADYLASFVARSGLDRANADCGDLLTRARVTVSLAMLDAAVEKGDAELTASARATALRAAEQRLSCNPLDGNAWLRYAIATSRGDGPIAQVVDDLRMSYWTTPSEGWIVEPRLDFATGLLGSGVTGFEAEYLEDLRRFASFEPASRVGAAFVETSPPVRARMRSIIDTLPETHKKTIIGEIDALGVDYWEQ